MTPRRNTPTSQLASRKSRPVHEWIGGHVPAPFFVQDHVEPYRPDIVIWMELPNHLVVGQAVLAPGDNHGALARILRSAIVNPTVGEPKQPDAIRIANHDLADEVRAEVAGTIPVTVAPTPELDELFQILVASMPAPGDDEPSYFAHGRVSADIVEQRPITAHYVHVRGAHLGVESGGRGPPALLSFRRCLPSQ